MDMIDLNEFNTGNVVKIRKFKHTALPYHWSTTMAKFCGEIVTVHIYSATNNKVYLKEHPDYYWKPSDFCKINEEL